MSVSINHQQEVAYGLTIDTVLETLNDLEWRNSSYFAFFTQFDSFAHQLHHSG